MESTNQPSLPEAKAQIGPRHETGNTYNQDVDAARNVRRIKEVETRVEQAEARTEYAKTRTEQAETRMEQAETRIEHAEARTDQAEARTEQAEARSERSETRMEAAEAQNERSIEALARLNAKLEQRVAERTAQLQAANQELEAFSYSVSHDLRAPLRHIVGFVAMVHKEPGPALSAGSLRHLATISGSAKRMGELIDDLLAFSRIGKTAMQKTGINLDELIREALGDFKTEIAERQIVWTIDPLPMVWADRALLRMVLVNLISNAVKFTGNCAKPAIEFGWAPSGEGETVIFIRDNGAGFDPKYSAKLFGVFQRLHSQSQFEGTGIGLANIQRIIHRHGGRVWAEGVVDGGATFYFSIPRQGKGINEP